MRAAARLFRWLGIVLGLLIVVLLAAFGLLQTQPGKSWLERTIVQSVSSPDFAVTMQGLDGLVPFRLKVERIDIADRDGTYLTVHKCGLDISPAALLAGRLHIRSLRFAAIDMARSSTAPSTTPFTEYLKVPRLPVGVVLDRLSIGRLALAPLVVGDSLIATVEGSARLADETAQVALDVHRTDDSAGNIALAMELAGEPPVLKLQLAASEPTGVLLDGVLGRTDRAPLALSVNGTGPLPDWHGRVAASAGTLAHVEADVTLAVTSQTVLGLSGTAALAPLLPAEFAPLVGDRIAPSLHATFADRIVVAPLSIEIAAGKLTGDAAFGGAEKAVEAHFRASVPDLSPLEGFLGSHLNGSASLSAAVTGTESRPAIELDLSGSGIRFGSAGADHISAKVSGKPTGGLGSPGSRIEFAAQGRIEGIVTPEGVAVPPELGRDIDWSVTAIATRDGSAVDLTHLSAEGAGLALAGAGQLTEGGQAIEGGVQLSIADLRPFSGLAGHPLSGSVELAVDADREGAAGFKTSLRGSAKGLRTGIAAADALLGDTVTLTGSLQRNSAGALVVDQLAIAGAAARLSGDPRFDPASHRLAAALALQLAA